MVFKIDSQDLEIIKIINANARIPLITLAKKMKLSLNAVKNRIQAMEQEGVIRGYSCELIPGCLGEETALARITIGPDVENLKDVVDIIGNNSLVFLVGVGLNNQLVVVFTYRTSSEIIHLENFVKKVPFVQKIEIFLLMSSPLVDPPEIANIDYYLVSVLRGNGRMSYQELSQKTQISSRTLKKRIAKLVEEKIIYFPLILSPGSSEDLIIFTAFITVMKDTNKVVFFQNLFLVYPNAWVGWIVVDKPLVIVIFYSPSIKNIQRTNELLKMDPDVKSCEIITGGEGYYYSDWRQEYIDKMGQNRSRKGV